MGSHEYHNEPSGVIKDLDILEHLRDSVGLFSKDIDK
jgi:hypothetical protein